MLPGVLQCLADGIVSGAVERNREASEQCVRAAEGVDAAMLDLCFDAQTSGGLLIAVREADAPVLLQRLHERGITEATQIGYVSGPGTGEVTVRTSGSRRMPAQTNGHGSATGCVPGPSQSRRRARAAHRPTRPTAAATWRHRRVPRPTVAANGSEAEAKFHEFMQAANAPGLLDARTKKAMAIALSVITKCEPCLKSHIAEGA